MSSGAPVHKTAAEIYGRVIDELRVLIRFQLAVSAVRRDQTGTRLVLFIWHLDTSFFNLLFVLFVLFPRRDLGAACLPRRVILRRRQVFNRIAEALQPSERSVFDDGFGESVIGHVDREIERRCLARNSLTASGTP